MISPLDHWKVTKEALEKYGYSGLGMLSFASLCESIKSAQLRVQWTARLAAQVKSLLSSLMSTKSAFEVERMVKMEITRSVKILVEVDTNKATYNASFDENEIGEMLDWIEMHTGDRPVIECDRGRPLSRHCDNDE